MNSDFIGCMDNVNGPVKRAARVHPAQRIGRGGARRAAGPPRAPDRAERVVRGKINKMYPSG